MKTKTYLAVLALFLMPFFTSAQTENSSTGIPASNAVSNEEVFPVSAKATLVNSDIDDFSVVLPDTKNNSSSYLSVQAAPGNNNCSSAIPLVVGDPCVNGTTKQSTTQSGESFGCQSSPNQSVWYSFQATSANMFVEVERTASSGCYLSSAVFSGGCLPSNVISCEDAANGPNLNVHNLTGLTINATYLVQVSYKAGQFCGSSNNSSTGADFCIRAGNTVNCSSCGNSCGTVCVFATSPTVSQVVNNCPEYALAPRINVGESTKQCYTFMAVAASFSLQMIINSTGCSGGNVTSFNWELYSAGCGSPVQTGNLSNLNATGLTTGQNYTLCYEWTAACQHNYVYPYIIATSPLPISLLYFEGKQKEQTIQLDWITATEKNNDYFSVQRSSNGTDFYEISQIKGAGNSNNTNKYRFTDSEPLPGVNYYRLVQFDYDKQSSTSQIIAIRFDATAHFQLLQNPANERAVIAVYAENEMNIRFEVLSQQGQTILFDMKNAHQGNQTLSVDISTLSKGSYIMKATYPGGTKWIRMVKM